MMIMIPDGTNAAGGGPISNEKASEPGAHGDANLLMLAPKKPVWKRIPNFGLLGWLGIAILCFWSFLALFGPLIAPHGESEIIDGSLSFSKLGEGGFLGLDYLGRDILSRVIYGTRTTLGLALAATAIAFLVGGSLGIIVVIIGGLLEDVASRLVDGSVAFPAIMLALVVVSAVGSSLSALVLTVGLIEAARVYRIARALAQDVMSMDFVEISLARGESRIWVMWHEVMPNALIPLSTDLGLRFTYSILLLSGLSFLGLGVQPPYADWGVMVRENLLGLTFAPHSVLIPALAIYSVTLAVNFLVDWNLARGNRDISNELVK